MSLICAVLEIFRILPWILPNQFKYCIASAVGAAFRFVVQTTESACAVGFYALFFTTFGEAGFFFSRKVQQSMYRQVSPGAAKSHILVSVGFSRACASPEQWALRSDGSCDGVMVPKYKQRQPGSKASFPFHPSLKTGPARKIHFQQKVGFFNKLSQSSHLFLWQYLQACCPRCVFVVSCTCACLFCRNRLIRGKRWSLTLLHS